MAALLGSWRAPKPDSSRPRPTMALKKYLRRYREAFLLPMRLSRSSAEIDWIVSRKAAILNGLTRHASTPARPAAMKFWAYSRAPSAG